MRIWIAAVVVGLVGCGPMQWHQVDASHWYSDSFQLQGGVGTLKVWFHAGLPATGSMSAAEMSVYGPVAAGPVYLFGPTAIDKSQAQTFQVPGDAAEVQVAFEALQPGVTLSPALSITQP